MGRHFTALCVASTWLVPAVLAGEVVLVRDGLPGAVVVLGQDASAELRDAAALFVRYVEEASGARLPLVVGDPAPALPAAVRVLVGTGQPGVPRDLLPPELDDDGFVVVAEGDRVIVAGPTDAGTAFGVYDLLERHLGVRWLLPGADGTDVPARRTIVIPAGRRQDQPVFFSRLFSGLRGPAQTEWARLNRMHGRVSFHHNLIRLFPPETYTKTHPEFFPMKDGQTRFLPPTNETHGWQPCFSARGLVEEAVVNIVRSFRENPAQRSFSLGVNDSSGHCRCPACLVRVPAEKNFLDRADYSDLYFDWCNRVIEGVLKEFPEAWFGCLAYSEVAAPPRTVRVHPRLIPYMTYDRMKWIHPEIEAAGHAATEAWQAVSPTLGWYDYIYGSPYCLPRVYFHESAEYLGYGRDHGVRALYAEIYPNFGEGPKPYLYLRLWWNPAQDVEVLLNEWYERCVGPEAAPDLARYYALWEGFWTRDILASKWFSKGGQYLAFNSPGYLADVRPEAIAESRRLLESCIAKCQTDRQRARARLLERAFQYYEASAMAYLAHVGAAQAQTGSETAALDRLEQAVQGLTMAQKRRDLAAAFVTDPVLVHPIGLDRTPALAGTTWGGGGLWALADWARRGPNPVRQRVESLAATAAADLVREQAATLLALADGKTGAVAINGSFEDGSGDQATGWSFWRKPDVPPEKPLGRMARAAEAARTGAFGLLCEGILRGGPVRTVDLPGPGRYVAMVHAFAPAEPRSPGTVELSLTPVDSKGASLPAFSSGRLLPNPGTWTVFTVGLTVAATPPEKQAAKVRIVPILDGFQDGGKLFLDDVELHRVGQ